MIHWAQLVGGVAAVSIRSERTVSRVEGAIAVGLYVVLIDVTVARA